MTKAQRKTCIVDLCKCPPDTDGMCKHHHTRFLKTGVIDNLRKMSFEERLWSWIDKRSEDECWPWLMRSKIDGYGVLSRGPKLPTMLAHRAAWESVNGPIPSGEGYHGTVVMHVCDNRQCCNPGHLRLGTQADNVLDMRRKGRNVDLKTGCGRDHPRALPLLNDNAIREIRDRSKPRKWLADKYGIKPSNVDNIRGGRTWKHVA